MESDGDAADWMRFSSEESEAAPDGQGAEVAGAAGAEARRLRRVQARAPRYPVPRLLPYLTACACIAMSSGGLILGVGPFGSRLVKEGYVTSEEIAIIFTGAFQIMTWGAVVAVHIESRWGPRWCAVLGASVELVGCLILGHLSTPADPHVVMIAYGLLGFGGAGIFFTCLQFSRLFPDNLGVADGFMASLFNLAGLVFLIFNVSSITIRGFFNIWVFVTSAALLAILTLWPDRSYNLGSRAFVSFPRLRCRRRSLCSVRRYTASWRSIRTPRYLLYVLTFSWSALVTQYTLGNLGVYHTVDIVGDGYLRWGFPLIANPTCIFAWCVGTAIDSKGFGGMAALLIFICQLSLWCLWAADSAVAAWANLVLLNWATTIQYTIEFAFLHKTVPSEAYPGALILVLITQGLFGFVANPGLSPNPWGENRTPPVVLLLLPSLLLYAWPLLEWRHRARRHRQPPEAAQAPPRPPPPPSPPAQTARSEILGVVGQPATPTIAAYY